jgi:hypothetical protein
VVDELNDWEWIEKRSSMVGGSKREAMGKVSD